MNVTPGAESAALGPRRGKRRQRVGDAPRIAPRLLTVDQVADYLSVGVFTIYSWAAGGLLTPIELPARPPREGDRPRTRLRVLRFDRVDVDRFIELRKRPQGATR